MRHKRALAALGTCAASLGLIIGLAPQAAAADHWSSDLKIYPNQRPSYTAISGRVSCDLTVTWNNSYDVSVYGDAYDDKAGDGLAAYCQVSYWYKSGSSWKWTSRNLVNTAGTDQRYASAASKVDMKYLQTRVCMGGRNGIIQCSDWDA